MDVPVALRSVEGGNVARLFEATADRRGDAVAIEMDGRELSYESLDERAAAFAGGLHERGFDPGDRLLLYLPNCPEYVVVLLGAFRAGVVVSPVNPQYKARELSYQLEDTDASVAVTHPVLREELIDACAET
ncbi:AMP-binding protein, partial [Haladaptatus sp.]|uniref:AMP-binding protein n=1 Tax=Haladaptatus sp. TaxID=1973141 RepID=UPI003C49921E